MVFKRSKASCRGAEGVLHGASQASQAEGLLV